jgi:hypothetical protein
MRFVMQKTLEKRIRKLESMLQSRARSAVVFRYGRVKHLPEDTVGERHIAIATSSTTAVCNVEQCEFEERIGPAGCKDDFGFRVYLCSEADDGGQP